ncbi:response regulator [Brumimicrobium glaciale]|uniref:Response regulator n=1 Tax=Brumimicrobium glaciale TaxID=200475 RepID=A0A4Q4KJC3_9FLAO|nr:response regulator [Brumimicrobium glaciale]RYM33371.1 response regulator [Brumimicrobium glaciale]
MLNSKKTCVLIDDDEDDQLIFQTVLNMHFPKYQLSAFSSFEKAEKFILSESKNIHSIFVDLNMPKYNGIDCLNFLRSQTEFQYKPIIIYSTSSNPDDVNRCLKNGATAFMTKPSRVNELVEELEVYLER